MIGVLAGGNQDAHTQMEQLKSLCRWLLLLLFIFFWEGGTFFFLFALSFSFFFFDVVVDLCWVVCFGC